MHISWIRSYTHVCTYACMSVQACMLHTHLLLNRPQCVHQSRPAVGCPSGCRRASSLRRNFSRRPAHTHHSPRRLSTRGGAQVRARVSRASRRHVAHRITAHTQLTAPPPALPPHKQPGDRMPRQGQDPCTPPSRRRCRSMPCLPAHASGIVDAAFPRDVNFTHHTRVRGTRRTRNTELKIDHADCPVECSCDAAADG